LLLETDCPFLSPEPKRGRRNEPAHVVYIAQKLAEIKKVTFEEVTEITTSNAKRLFGLGEWAME
jgi:TatD DNase family protein